MSRWGNSKELTQASYSLVKDNPGMYRWTVLAAVHGAVIGAIGSVVGLALMLVGDYMINPDAPTEPSDFGFVPLVFGAIVVLGSVIGGLTAANRQLAGLIRVTDDVLHGRTPDEDAALDAAHSRLGALAAWSAISVAVGTLVSLINGDGSGGFITAILRSLLAGLVAAVWAVLTTLVMPLIVLEQLGAVAAIKRSAGIIRTTWGEAVLGSVRIGARFALVFGIPGGLLLVGGVVLAVVVEGAAIPVGAVLALCGVALIVVGSVKAATCRNVFGVALYRWANGDGALGPFSESDLRGAVEVKDSPVPVG
ncbi:MAG: DUF6159 family protein [Microthrixaceae bacterium]|nr:hypothetical protein [Microthrixaceae bacterium]MCO5319861.1 DUF6159 family protein [Microthrixaceae bacterium]